MDRYRDIVLSSSIQSVLSWDRETGKLPAGGVEHRSDQVAYLTQIQQDFWTSNEIKHLLDSINLSELDHVGQRNVELITRSYQTKSQIPRDLIVTRAKQASKTTEIWKKAKRNSDFSIVQNEMEKLVELNRDYATELAEIRGISNPLSALIDERDEGLTAEKISKYFTELKSFLVPFIEKHRAELTDFEENIRKISLTNMEEKHIVEYIADRFNYPYEGDSARGNIDVVEHPLTITCGPNDVRITYKPGNYLQVILASAHELGHAMHRLHSNPDWNFLPLNYYSGPSLAECTSRYTENKIGKSYEFIANLFPELNEISSYRFQEVSLDDFYKTITAIHPGPNRISADEVTYGLHIIIRQELEQELFDDTLEVADLPQAWNQKYEDYLGVEVQNDAHGVMQDLHWYSVYYGYFHGYLMGDLLGSQFHYSMIEQVPDWEEQVLTGDLNEILEWHTENIYAKGSLYPVLDHVEEVTGEKLQTKYYKQYLEQKFNS